MDSKSTKNSELSTKIYLRLKRNINIEGIVVGDDYVQLNGDHMIFNKVFTYKMSQQEIYNELKPSFQCNTNKNFSLIFYGNSNSGKSYTMIGNLNSDSFENLGVFPRYVNSMLSEKKFESLNLAAIEIYLNNVYDLLDSQKKIEINHNFDFGLDSKQVKYHDLVNYHDFNNLLQFLLSKRITSLTQVNYKSSRSHLLLILCQKVDSKLYYSFFFDLAGAERQKEAKTDGIHYQESLYINKSLMLFTKMLLVCSTKRKNKFKTTEFRQSKLNILFSYIFDAQTILVFCADGSCVNKQELIFTLKFSSEITKSLFTRKNHKIVLNNLKKKPCISPAVTIPDVPNICCGTPSELLDSSGSKCKSFSESIIFPSVTPNLPFKPTNFSRTNFKDSKQLDDLLKSEFTKSNLSVNCLDSAEIVKIKKSTTSSTIISLSRPTESFNANAQVLSKKYKICPNQNPYIFSNNNNRSDDYQSHYFESLLKSCIFYSKYFRFTPENQLSIIKKSYIAKIDDKLRYLLVYLSKSEVSRILNLVLLKSIIKKMRNQSEEIA